MSVSLERLASIDPIWSALRSQAQELAAREPALASFVHATILNHSRLEDALSYHLAKKVGVEIKRNNASARKAEADGEATYIRDTGAAKGAEVEAVGMARAKAYKEQVRALGQRPTALVNAVDALSRSGQKFVPNILLIGGGAGGQTLEGLAAQLMGVLEGREEEMAAVVAEAPGAGRSPGETAGAGSMPMPEQPPAPPRSEQQPAPPEPEEPQA